MNFDKLINRRYSDSIKWNKYGEDVLPLWVADTDFPPPDSVISALRNRLDHGVFGYSKPQEFTREAIQSWLLEHHEWSVETNDILLLPGVVQGFNLTALAYTNPGESVLVQTPAYHPFLEVAENANLIQQTHQLSRKKDGSYAIDIDEFKNSITPETRVFLLCNPQNPSGRVFTKTELSQMADACLEKNIIICSDEIHCDLTYKGYKHIPTASLSPEISAQTITLISASKTFNLAGLESSAAIISNPALKDRFCAQMKGLIGSVNIFGETALAAAYSQGADYLIELLDYLQVNRDVLVNYVNAELPGIRISAPEGTFLGWLDCSATNIEDPAHHFLEHAKVALNPGSWFGNNFQKFARINFGCPRETLLTALSRIKGSLVQVT
jgi:cystathionine beta-lyase